MPELIPSRPRTRRRVLLLLGLLAAVGCEQQPFAGDALELDFRIEGQVTTPPQFSATGNAGAVEVRGQYGAHRCYAREVKRATLDGTTITLRVEFSGRRAGSCPGVLDVFPYGATIRGLAPGTYQLRVEHYGTEDVYLENGVMVDVPDGVRLDTQVTVN
ncbi:MAG TPA: hypothetical protein VFQ45_06220 [Longimicrobium sp.]|nr:hypothetical protein [Longimicrobium sp.]